MMRRWELKKDIVIKAGTQFVSHPSQTMRSGRDQGTLIINLTDITCGFMEYSMDAADEELGKWFMEV